MKVKVRLKIKHAAFLGEVKSVFRALIRWSQGMCIYNCWDKDRDRE